MIISDKLSGQHVFMCKDLKSDLENARPHCKQAYGFSPVWFLVWIWKKVCLRFKLSKQNKWTNKTFNAVEVVHVFSQNLHW